ncbi:cAMP-dependent protein kinase type II-beta regulatory subunit [Desmophyllum pertusum]|uniref:cAMP-dependent protein kinase type II-beta regulatory subunit n=1 Tax=Desmophyllum pertusum TaxID=174260 RepID=A0A9W9ZTF1_9CNID|nr:cAMP-dependent protein kinase type II-beta regulatory subunit [Desmophyllum pertusum]
MMFFIDKDGKDIKVHTFKDEGSFGELALMYNCPRNATIIAKSQGTIWALDQATFRRIVVGAAARKRQNLRSASRKRAHVSSTTGLRENESGRRFGNKNL